MRTFGPPQPLKRLSRTFALLVLLAIAPAPGMFFGTAAAQSGAEKRLALVVGNASYKQFPLDNPVRDARAIAAELQKLGFEVLAFENIGAAKFRRELANFAKRIKADDGVSVFYYAGHGIGVRGRNLLVPVDASITSEESAFTEPVDVDFHLLSQIEGAKKYVNLVILDACRDDPFVPRGNKQKGGGLVEMGAKNSLIAYATRPGEVAQDGELGRNGVFTGALLAQMQVPGVEVRSMFTRVRADVLQVTKEKQYPYVNDLLVRDFYLRPGETGKSDKDGIDTAQQKIDAAVASMRAKQDEDMKRLLGELAALRKERDEARQLADAALERAQLAGAAAIAPVAQIAMTATAPAVLRSAESADKPDAQAAKGAEAARLAAAAKAAETERIAAAAKAAEAERIAAAAKAAEAERVAAATKAAEAERTASAARAEAARTAEAARLAQIAKEADAVRALAAAKEADSRREADERDRQERLRVEALSAEQRYLAALEKDRIAQLRVLRVEESPQLAALDISPEPQAAVRERNGDLLVRGVRLPADLRVAAAGDGVPAECRAFLGAWGRGRWDLRRTAEVWIEQVNADCSVKATYGRGAESTVDEAPTYERVTGKVDRGMLTLPLSGGKRITLRLTREKTLLAEWTDGRNRSSTEFEPISPRADQPAQAYALEDDHDGRQPTRYILPGNFRQALPKTVPGATTINTLELRALIDKRKDAVLVDAFASERHRSVPNSIWLPNIGQADGYPDRHFKLGAKEFNEIGDALAKSTGGDLDRPIVVFERSTAYGWLGYHGTLRVLGLGYRNVYWYRGGMDAWNDAGFTMAQAR